MFSNNNNNVSKLTGQIHILFENMSLFLKDVVVFTFNQELKSKQKSFFLIGYEHKRGFSKRIYGDPKTTAEGADFKWQLRNLRWHLAKYAEKMNIYDDVLDDLTGFLLDTCYKCYLGSSLLTKAASDHNLLNDSFEVCIELVSAIEEAEFYLSLKHESSELKKSLQKQFNTFNNHSNLSVKALKFTEEFLVPSLLKEVTSGSDQVKPITKLILNYVQPQLVKDMKEDDSGSTVQSSSTNTPMRNTSNTLPINQSMDSSMIIINTPTVKNKPIDQLKKFSQKRTPPKKVTSTDVMDGSFVMI